VVAHATLYLLRTEVDRALAVQKSVDFCAYFRRDSQALFAGNIQVESLCGFPGRRVRLCGSRCRAQGAPLRYARAARGYRP
jgi:hypothetical protein